MTAEITKKLNMKPGQRLWVLNPPEDFQQILDGVDITAEGSAPAEAVLLFVGSLAELKASAPGGLGAVDRKGLMWIAYPKSSSGVKTDINRDTLWEAMKPSGWRPVRQVALDGTWSALRFRPAEDVDK